MFRELVVIGSRTFSDSRLLFDFCDKIGSPFDVVWSGGSSGADELGARWARSRGKEFQVFPANWPKFRRSAGFRRSAEMIQACSSEALVVCFIDRGLSFCPGSLFTVSLARDRGLGVLVVGPGPDDLEQYFCDRTQAEFDLIFLQEEPGND